MRALRSIIPVRHACRSIHQGVSFDKSERHGFDPHSHVSESKTPPSCWYTSENIFEEEKDRVFGRDKSSNNSNWIPGALWNNLDEPGKYESGVFLNEPYLFVNDEGNSRAFYNVCQHHAAKLVNGCGSANSLTCPYHGWQYKLDGRLQMATKLKGIKNFKASQIKLKSIDSHRWGPLMFLNFFNQQNTFPDLKVLNDRMRIFLQGDHVDNFHKHYQHVKTCTYRVKSNWKVVLENYLDGGYHVRYLHKGLDAQLDSKSYTVERFENYSIQSAAPSKESSRSEKDFKDRIGDLGALYAYIYPNWMVNIYTSMADFNVVVPVDVNTTDIVYHYFFHKSRVDDLDFVSRGLEASHQVQMEDTEICESVQMGLNSSGYENGYYAPELEHIAHHFHQLLYKDLSNKRINL
ncbi:choline monooxygenase [Acrasis kona]|uniref:Choline monooxygenase, chloroplastic n=1 Tax=Acrasis kona TaxID=1008807 RepID=A0AAW2YNX7_9EUKA